MYRSEEQIKQDMLKNIPDNTDKSENSFINNAISAASLEFANTFLEVEKVANKLDVDNLEGDELDRFIYQRTGIVRKPATKAVTTVVISGTEGAKVNKGVLVSTGEVNFMVLEEANISQTGQTTVFVACEQYGSVGSVPANSITVFSTSVNGLVDVYNPEPVTNGFDAESDEDLRQRYYDKLQRPGKAGNRYHYLEWAKEVIGVGDAIIYPRWNGPLTVKVVIIDSNGQPASTELVDSVFGHIENQKPFGADVAVVSATGRTIDISINLVISNLYTQEQVENNIKEKITEYLKGLAFKSDYVSYAKIGGLILSSEGVIDYTNLTINNSTSNITVGEGEVAILGVVSCTF